MADSNINGLTSGTPTTDDFIIFYDNADGVTKKGAISTLLTGTGDMVLASAQTNSGLKTFLNGTLGIRNLTNSFSGFFSFTNNGADATFTLPISSDTLVGRAVAETLTNKILTSPILTTPSLGVATATSINGATITSGTLNGSVTGTNTGDETTGRINTLYGTTNAITVGSVELGHATDTTISRAGAGVVAIEGTTINGYATTATAVGTTTLTIASPIYQQFSGTTTQTIVLPTTSVLAGQFYIIINGSTGNVTVQSSGLNTIQILGAGMAAYFRAIVATPTTAVNWSVTLNTFQSQNIAITATTNAANVNLAHVTNTITNNSAATLTITLPTAGAIDGEMRIVRALAFSAVAQTLTWVNTENSTVTAPILLNASTTLPVTAGFQYNGATSLWRCVASV